MSGVARKKSIGTHAANLLQHGAITLEFVGHSDNNECDPIRKKKVQELLTQMYVRARKRGRPRLDEEKEAA